MKISLVLIIYRSNSTIAKDTASFCESILREKKILSLKIDSNFNEKLLKENLDNISEKPNLAIVLGGDGTVLKSANELANLNIPILSFNIGGNLGFLTQDKKFLFDKSFLSLLQKDQFDTDTRTMLECTLYTNNLKEKKYEALNDFYFKSIETDISPTNRIRLEIDNEKVNEFKGDGLIISSATGSTAYSMAAGGPIVHPLISAFVINPICPMSLSSRPIVVPDTSKIVVKIVDDKNKFLQLWKDGTKCQMVNYSNYCKIKKGSKPTKMIVLRESISYYNTLTKKLEWKGNLS